MRVCRTLLAVALFASLGASVLAQGGWMTPMPEGEQASALRALRDFAARFLLARPLDLSGEPLKQFRCLETHYCTGAVGGLDGSMVALEKRGGVWRVRTLSTALYREEATKGVESQPLLKTEEDVWSHADKLLAPEIGLGEGLERGSLVWLGWEGRAKLAAKISYKPKPRDHPIGADSIILHLVLRASDGAVIDAALLPPPVFEAMPIKLTEREAIKTAAEVLKVDPALLTARLAYTSPTSEVFGRTGFGSSGEPRPPVFRLSWEVSGDKRRVSLNPETGRWEHTLELSDGPSPLLVVDRPSPEELKAFDAQKAGPPEPPLGALLQGAAIALTTLAVALVVRWLLKSEKKEAA